MLREHYAKSIAVSQVFRKHGVKLTSAGTIYAPPAVLVTRPNRRHLETGIGAARLRVRQAS